MRSMFFLPRPTCALSQRLAKSGHHDTVSGLLTGSQGSPLNESVSSSSLAVRLSAPAPASSPVGDASLELAPASLSTFLPGVAPAVPSTSADADSADAVEAGRSEEHTSELQSLMRISYAVFCLKKKKPLTNSHLTNSSDSD